MEKLYKYTGKISSFSYKKVDEKALSSADIILYDLNDDDKAPIRIEATGGLADYINGLSWTDAEERYIVSNWYYNSTLHLLRIEVPCAGSPIPAKIIAQHNTLSHLYFIFGPAYYIESPTPEPMSKKQLDAWWRFKANDNYVYIDKKEKIMEHMEHMIRLSHDEIQKRIPYQLICETVYSVSWKSGKRKRMFKQAFTEAEQKAIYPLLRKAYRWALVTGAPERTVMLNKTYLLWRRLGEFCASL